MPSHREIGVPSQKGDRGSWSEGRKRCLVRREIGCLVKR